MKVLLDWASTRYHRSAVTVKVNIVVERDILDKIIGKRNQEKVQRKLLHYIKRLLFALRRPAEETQPIFIMGYGRSGTSMLLNTFARDLRIEILRENDPRVAENFLLVPERIAPTINACKADVLVMKPILNSFDAKRMMDEHNGAKIIWVIRKYQDVIASTIKKFGGVVPDYMRQLVLYGKGDNWLARGLPEDTLEELKKLNSDEFTDYDWAALVWWAVNRTIIIHKLYQSDRVMLVQYEQLVQTAEKLMHEAYKFIGLQYKQSLGAYMHSGSVGKGADIKLDSVVDHMCTNLSREINEVC